MSTTRVEFKPDGDIIMCPNCKVCSIAISKDEREAVMAGQQMLVMCKVCGKETVLNGVS